MTGILPIKKYGTHSALNMFDEISMINADEIAEYMGFVEEEVKDLCEEKKGAFEKLQKWYDGYRIGDNVHVYNPKSVVDAVQSHSSKDDYFTIQELPTGTGYADIVFLPRQGVEKPAMVIELKWAATAEGAITQIKEKKYIQAIANYRGDILLVGINYDKRTKKHKCIIEKCCI